MILFLFGVLIGWVVSYTIYTIKLRNYKKTIVAKLREITAILKETVKEGKEVL